MFVIVTLIRPDAPPEIFSPFPAESKHIEGLRKENQFSQRTGTEYTTVSTKEQVSKPAHSNTWLQNNKL